MEISSFHLNLYTGEYNSKKANDFQKAELTYPLLEIEKELAKRRHENQRDNTGKYQPLLPNESSGMATEKVATKIGLSRNTFERATTIIEKAPENIIQRKLFKNHQIHF